MQRSDRLVARKTLVGSRSVKCPDVCSPQAVSRGRCRALGVYSTVAALGASSVGDTRPFRASRCVIDLDMQGRIVTAILK